MANQGAIRAGQAFVELFADGSKLDKGLKEAAGKLKSWGEGIEAIGGKIAALGLAVATPLVGAAVAFGNAGDELLRMSERTGIAVESLAGLKFAGSQVGLSLEEMDHGIRHAQKSITEAAGGSAEMRKAFRELGISIKDVKGMGAEDQFRSIADGLAGIDDPTMRAALAMKLLGRAGTQLLPVLKDGSAGLDAMVAKGKAAGVIMGEEDAKAASQFAMAMRLLKSQLGAVVNQLGAALVPLLSDFLTWLTPVLKSSIDWIKANKGLIVTIFEVSLVAVALGAGLMVLGKTIGLVGSAILTAWAGVQMLVSAFALLLTPIGLVVVAVTALGAYLLEASGAWDAMKDTAVAAWGGIVDAVMSGDIVLAMKIVWAGIKAVWAEGIASLRVMWSNYSTNFAKGLLVIGYYLGAISHAQGKAMNDALNQIDADEKQRITKDVDDAAEALGKLRKQAADQRAAGDLGWAKMDVTIAKKKAMSDYGSAAGTFSATAALRMSAGGSLEELAQTQIDKLEDIRGLIDRGNDIMRDGMKFA